MSSLHEVNISMRIDAIKVLLRNHPVLIEALLVPDQSTLNTEATPEALELIDPGDILIRLAWDIWNGGGESELDKVFNQLHQDDFDAFVDSMTAYNAFRLKVRDIYTSGSEDD